MQLHCCVRFIDNKWLSTSICKTKRISSKTSVHLLYYDNLGSLVLNISKLELINLVKKELLGTSRSKETKSGILK